MLDSKEFQEKYQTTYKQVREESYLEEVSADDKIVYSDVEILTGRDKKGTKVNKFNLTALGNQGNTEISAKKKLTLQWNKFLEGMISEEDIIEIGLKIVQQAKNGETKQQQMILDRGLGKVVDRLEVKTEGNIKYTFDLGEKNIEDKE